MPKISELPSGTSPIGSETFPAVQGGATVKLTRAQITQDSQPIDSDLTAIAALTTATYGRSLLTLANVAALAAEVDSFFLTPAEGGAAYQPLDSDLTALAANSTDGLWAHTGAGTGAARTITGTANEITITNGNGVSGNPTASLPASLTFTGKAILGGTFTTPTLVKPAITMANNAPIYWRNAADAVDKAMLRYEPVNNDFIIGDDIGASSILVFGASFSPVSDNTQLLGRAANRWASIHGFNFTFYGTSSGNTIVKAGAAASGTLTLPAATDTLVGKATTDTLTNKTINGASNTLTVRLANDVSGTLPVANGGTGDTGTAWTTYTPTLGSGTGSLTSASATGRYKSVGKTVFVEMTITITTNGTAGAFVTATLPAGMTAVADTFFGGKARAVSGKLVGSAVQATGGTLAIGNYDNTYPGANGEIIVISGVFENT